MTRINTVHPRDLTDQWLLAEWRELPRIVNELEKHPTRFKPADIPSNYTLNTGHVKFFRNKLLFLAKRHRALKRELRQREIAHDKRVKVELFYLSDTIKKQALNDWTPHSDDHNILIERLQERFDLRKKSYTLTNGNCKQLINCEQSFNTYLNDHLAKYF
jgi:deoxyribonuclease (pyrimidine dimer)